MWLWHINYSELKVLEKQPAQENILTNPPLPSLKAGDKLSKCKGTLLVPGRVGSIHIRDRNLGLRDYANKPCYFFTNLLLPAQTSLSCQFFINLLFLYIKGITTSCFGHFFESQIFMAL